MRKKRKILLRHNEWKNALLESEKEIFEENPLIDITEIPIYGVSRILQEDSELQNEIGQSALVELKEEMNRCLKSEEFWHFRGMYYFDPEDKSEYIILNDYLSPDGAKNIRKHEGSHEYLMRKARRGSAGAFLVVIEAAGFSYEGRRPIHTKQYRKDGVSITILNDLIDLSKKMMEKHSPYVVHVLVKNKLLEGTNAKTQRDLYLEYFDAYDAYETSIRTFYALLKNTFYRQKSLTEF